MEGGSFQDWREQGTAGGQYQPGFSGEGLTPRFFNPRGRGAPGPRFHPAGEAPTPRFTPEGREGPLPPFFPRADGGQAPRFTPHGGGAGGGPRFTPQQGGAMGPRFTPHGGGGGPRFTPQQAGAPGPRFTPRDPGSGFYPRGGRTPGLQPDSQGAWPPFNRREELDSRPPFRPQAQQQPNAQGLNLPISSTGGGTHRPPFNNAEMNGVLESSDFGSQRTDASSMRDPLYGSRMSDSPFVMGSYTEHSGRDPKSGGRPFTSHQGSTLPQAHQLNDSHQSPSLGYERHEKRAEDGYYRESYPSLDQSRSLQNESMQSYPPLDQNRSLKNESMQSYPPLDQNRSLQNESIHNQNISPYSYAYKANSPGAGPIDSRKRSYYPFVARETSPNGELKRSRKLEPHDSEAYFRSPRRGSKDRNMPHPPMASDRSSHRGSRERNLPHSSMTSDRSSHRGSRERNLSHPSMTSDRSSHRGSKERNLPHPSTTSDRSGHRGSKERNMPHPSTTSDRSSHRGSKERNLPHQSMTRDRYSQRVTQDIKKEFSHGSVSNNLSHGGTRDGRTKSPQSSTSRHHSPHGRSKEKTKDYRTPSSQKRSPHSRDKPSRKPETRISDSRGRDKDRKSSTYRTVSRGRSPRREGKSSTIEPSRTSVRSHRSPQKGSKDNAKHSPRHSVSRRRSPPKGAVQIKNKPSSHSLSNRQSSGGVTTKDSRKESPRPSKSRRHSPCKGPKSSTQPTHPSSNHLQSAAVPVSESCGSDSNMPIRHFLICLKNKIIRKYLKCYFNKYRFVTSFAEHRRLLTGQEIELTVQDEPKPVPQGEHCHKSQVSDSSLSENKAPNDSISDISSLSSVSPLIGLSSIAETIGPQSGVSVSNELEPTEVPAPQPMLRRFGVKAEKFDLYYICRQIRQTLLTHFGKYGNVVSLDIFDQGGPMDRHAVVFYEHLHEQEKALRSNIRFGSLLGMVVTAWSGHSPEAELEPNATMLLHIGNLGKATTGSDLWGAFKRFGEILHIEVKTESDSANYAILQFCDITSVCKAITEMDGKYLGKNQLRLGFGKCHPTDCVWLSGLRTSKVIKQRLYEHCKQYGPLVKVLYNSKKTALILYKNVSDAEVAVKAMKAEPFCGNRIQVDFANRRCQLDFCQSMESAGYDVRKFYQTLVESAKEPRKRK